MVVVVDTLAALATPVMLAHEGTLNSSVSSKSFGSRRTTRGEAPKPEMARKDGFWHGDFSSDGRQVVNDLDSFGDEFHR